MQHIQFDVVITREEMGYSAYIPALPGCISEGDSFEQTIANIREAAELYLTGIDDMKLDKFKQPQTIFTSLALTLPATK